MSILARIIYNVGSGSDTAASGSNAPTTAVTGTNADITTTTVTLNETVDLTGVADDDTDVLWIDTPSGDRHLYRITAFTGGVSTCTALTVTPSAGTARTADNWAVGGLRASLDNDTSTPDLEDGLSGWQFELQAGTYPIGQTNTIEPTASSAADGSSSLVAAAGTSPVVSWTGDFAAITMAASTEWFVRGISFSNTTSTNVAARSISVTGNDCVCKVRDCTFDQFGSAFFANNRGFFTIIGCTVTAGITTEGAIRLGGGPKAFVQKCIIHDAGEWGIVVEGNQGNWHVAVISCIIRDCADDGIITQGGHQGVVTILNCVLHDNAGDGIRINGPHQAACRDVQTIANNTITNNGGYGINATNAWHEQAFIDHNAFRSNTSGEMNNITTDDNDVTLTADPYTDAATDDYTLNATAGGGAACTDAGYGYDG